MPWFLLFFICRQMSCGRGTAKLRKAVGLKRKNRSWVDEAKVHVILGQEYPFENYHVVQ